jgi:hypothetical protein
MIRRIFFPFLLAFLPLFAGAPALAAAPDVVLTGVLSGKDNQTYRELPFTVPAGVGKITVDVSWDGRSRGTILVLGLYDPQRLRGWGGGTKPHFVVANGFATPSYLPGPIQPGVWRLSLTVASIRPGEVSPYTVKITYGRGPEAQVIDDTPVRTGPGWYRGDLHSHTGHSDARCRSLAGRSTPCPLFFTLQAAVDHKLDFIVVTDHNVTSHVADLGELAGYFDTLLLIPGREMTTQSGHYNLLGVADFVEFRLGSPKTPNINAMFDASKATGALISINHPEIPTGEDCLGCGWSAADTDYSRVQSIEVANGGLAADQGAFDDGPGSGVAFWEALLNKGRHLTGVGGSDNHDAVDGRRGSSPVGAQSPVGFPATVVYAAELSQPAILQAIRSGRVFIDLEGAHPGRILDLAADAGGDQIPMGGTLARAKAQPIHARLHVAGAQGDKVDLIADGQPLPALPDPILRANDQTLDFTLPAAREIHWFRADVRAPDGRRILIGNPIYVETQGGESPARGSAAKQEPR